MRFQAFGAWRLGNLAVLCLAWAAVVGHEQQASQTHNRVSCHALSAKYERVEPSVGLR